MIDLPALLRQKEQDIERVRHEIEALLLVISLCEDPGDQPASDVVLPMNLTSSRRVEEPSKKGMTDLEAYYPFVRRTGTHEPKEEAS